MKRKKTGKPAGLWTLYDRMCYFRENNYRGFLLLMFVLINFVLFVVSALAVGWLPDNEGMSTRDILWKSFLLILDPGNLSSDPSALVTVIFSIITIAGMVCFSAGMVAFLSSMMKDYLEEIRDGETAIHYRHFTLFLGWNDRALALLKAFMRGERKGAVTDFVVILSKHDGRELRDDIMTQLREYRRYHEDTHALRILVRSGDSAEYSSLLDVGFKHADKVFVFRDDEENEPDFGVERAFFSLAYASMMQTKHNRKDGKKKAKRRVSVLVETLSEDAADLINRFHPERKGNSNLEVTAFSADRVLGRKYAGMIPEHGSVIICHFNRTLFAMLEEITKRVQAGEFRMPRVLLVAGEDQRKDVEKLYEDQRLKGIWGGPPAICHNREELCEKLDEGLDEGYQSAFIMSADDTTPEGGDYRNFELWATLVDELGSETELAENRIFFEMHNEADAQIIEGFGIGQCIISNKLITEQFMQNLRQDEQRLTGTA
ncbi:MAG: hypothetical protein IJ088_07685 [Clostridia bacterium]|nr:hypothetical protein [Clostridia bacterium]